MTNLRMENVGVLIPAYNAGATVGELLQRLARIVPTRNILVVNDGSTDETASIARQYNVSVTAHAVNQGKGRALRTGFEAFNSLSLIEAVCTIDADLQHKPEDLVAFVEHMRLSGADIVVGRRNRAGTKMPVHRRLSNTITSALVSVRTGANVLDSQCGYRLIRKDVLQNVSTESSGFEAETEFLIRALNQGYKVDFVPIDTIYHGGSSHMRNWTTTVNFVRVLFKDN